MAVGNDGHFFFFPGYPSEVVVLKIENRKLFNSCERCTDYIQVYILIRSLS